MNATRIPPHPGRYIEDARIHLGITVQELADALNVPLSDINQVIKGHASLTPDMAIRLATVVGSTAEMWLRLEHAHSLAKPDSPSI